MPTFPTTEGFIPFHGYHTWYRIVGNGEESGKLPLLVLHGGPGASSDYLEPLEAMARIGRRVIFYDQLGGGNSDHPHNPSMWTVELFVEELCAVRKAVINYRQKFSKPCCITNNRAPPIRRTIRMLCWSSTAVTSVESTPGRIA